MMYIGQAINIENRWYHHKYAAMHKAERMIVISKVMRKYGIENFKLSILEETNSEPEILGAAEIKWIKVLNTISPNGYNISEGGIFFSGPHLSEIARQQQKRYVKEGTHPWCGEKGSQFAKERSNKLLKEGRHNFQGLKGSINATTLNLKRVQEGTNAFSRKITCQYCNKTMNYANYRKWHDKKCKGKHE